MVRVIQPTTSKRNNKMDKEEYQAAIPNCCVHKTVEEHGDKMLYCWGITAGFVQEQGESYCNGCSENVNCKSKEL